MKKLLALILALTMLFALCACGSDTQTTQTPEKETATEPAQTEEAAAEETAEESPEETAEAPAADGETDWAAVAAEIDPLVINYNSTYNENETNGQLVKQFESYLSELSDGKITMNIYWGGTVYDDLTQFEALQIGAIDMMSFQSIRCSEYVPYQNFGSYGIGSAENVKELWDLMLFDDPEMSELIQGEIAEYNMIYLNTIGNGVDCLVSNFDWATLDELLAGSACIGSGDNAKFDAMGMNTTFVIPPETYDALQRGICDSSCCSLAAIYSMSWDEVAPNVVLDGMWACGGSYTANLDWWNGLSEGQRSIIWEAAQRLSDYSIQMNADEEATMIAQIEERSNTTVKSLSDEDAMTFFSYVFDTNASNSLNRVSGDAQKTADMTKILQFAADFYGYDWTPEA